MRWLIFLQFASLFRSIDQLFWGPSYSIAFAGKSFSFDLLPRNCAKLSFWSIRHVDNMLLWRSVHRDNILFYWSSDQWDKTCLRYHRTSETTLVTDLLKICFSLSDNLSFCQPFICFWTHLFSLSLWHWSLGCFYFHASTWFQRLHICLVVTEQYLFTLQGLTIPLYDSSQEGWGGKFHFEEGSSTQEGSSTFYS